MDVQNVNKIGLENEIESSLKYIKEFISASNKISKNKTKSQSNHNSSIYWLDFKSDDIRVIRKEIIKGQIDHSNLYLLNKKLSIIQIYLNVSLFTILLKYIEIIFKVKYGGLIYSSFGLFSFYTLNEYFTKYKSSQILNKYSSITESNPASTLHKLKNKEKYRSREYRLTKEQLNKYWKEPMAWH